MKTIKNNTCLSIKSSDKKQPSSSSNVKVLYLLKQILHVQLRLPLLWPIISPTHSRWYTTLHRLQTKVSSSSLITNRTQVSHLRVTLSTFSFLPLRSELLHISNVKLMSSMLRSGSTSLCSSPLVTLPSSDRSIEFQGVRAWSLRVIGRKECRRSKWIYASRIA